MPIQGSDQLALLPESDSALAASTEPVDAASGTGIALKPPSLLKRLLGRSNPKWVSPAVLRDELDPIIDELLALRRLHAEMQAQYMRLRKMEKRLVGKVPPPDVDPTAEGPRQVTKAELRSAYAKQRMSR